MNPLRKLRALLSKDKLDADMTEEMRLHIEMQTEMKLKAGMSADEAHHAALRQFGNVPSVQQLARQQRAWFWLEQIWSDSSYAVRVLRQSPGFALVAIFTLALGVCVTATTFGYLNATLFRPLPCAEPSGLVYFPRTQAPADLMDIREGNRVFDKFAIFGTPYFNLAERNEPPERVAAFTVSGDYFAIMGVPPLLGRVFDAKENQPGHDQVVILSYQYWNRRFARDPAMVGRTLRLDGKMVEVIGVMPEQSDYPILWGTQDLWKPLAMTADVAQIRRDCFLQAIARLKPGVTLDGARANIDAISSRLSSDYPLTNAHRSFPLVSLRQFASTVNQRGYWMLIALAASFLLLTCANLANLQLARSSKRATEFAVRLALGASRFRLVRQMFTESVILSLLGGGLGVLGTWWTNQILTLRLARVFEQPAFQLSIDLRVLIFALVITGFTAVIFGVLPALFVTRVGLNGCLKQAGGRATGGRSRHRLRQTLIVTELAITLALLAGAGCLINGFRQVSQRELGWRSDHLVTARVALPYEKYGDATKCGMFYARLLEELAAMPGIEKSVICDSLPVLGFYNTSEIVAEDSSSSGEESIAYVNPVSPEYFAALDAKIIRGRYFSAEDRAGAAAVVIVNRALAYKFWPNENPLGKRIGTSDPANRNWMEVVGVVNDVAFGAIPNPWTQLQIYRPIAQTGGNYFYVAARTSVRPESLADALRDAVRRVDRDQAVYRVASGEQVLQQSGTANNLLTSSFLFLALSGLLLSALGLYGIIANLVTERTFEIGVRVALGAQMRNMVWLILQEGMRLAAFGLVVGLAGAWALSRLLGSAIPEILSQDPAAITWASLTLLVVALLACWLPARRAAKVDPVVALRAE